MTVGLAHPAHLSGSSLVQNGERIRAGSTQTHYGDDAVASSFHRTSYRGVQINGRQP